MPAVVVSTIPEDERDTPTSQVQELGVKSVFNYAIAEFIGCMMFHFIGSVSPTAFTNSVILIVLVYYTAKISGAHLNPAVSLTFCMLGHTHPLEMLIYWIAQIAGCVAGALWIGCMVPGIRVSATPSGPYKEMSGCFTPAADLTFAEVFGWEAICTCCFIVPIFSVVWYTQHKKGYGNTGPFIVGMSLLANALVCGQFTGASLNPARTLGSQIVFDCPSKRYAGVYVAGELVGAVCAMVAIVPWYGISRSAWYIRLLSDGIFNATKNNHMSIVLETVSVDDNIETLMPGRCLSHIQATAARSSNPGAPSPRNSVSFTHKAFEGCK
jgi:glycerol uptake facilitator-like aquaporin